MKSAGKRFSVLQSLIFSRLRPEATISVPPTDMISLTNASGMIGPNSLATR